LAEQAYVDDPAGVDAFLVRIGIKQLTHDEKCKRVTMLAHALIKDEITAIPTQIWRSADVAAREQKNPSVTMKMEEEEDREPLQDEKIVNRFGFIFVAYRIDLWWFEGVEMFRKLLMTSVLVFVKAGTPGQMSTGAMITFAFLMVATSYRPFCTAGLNSLNVLSLVAQFCTLFVGINIALLDLVPKDVSGGADDKVDRAIIQIMVVLVNGATMVWPLLRKIMNGTFAGYYETLAGYTHACSSVYLSWCGTKEHKAKLAATAAGIKARKERKQERARLLRLPQQPQQTQQATEESTAGTDIEIPAGVPIPESISARDCILMGESTTDLVFGPNASMSPAYLENPGASADFCILSEVEAIVSTCYKKVADVVTKFENAGARL